MNIFIQLWIPRENKDHDATDRCLEFAGIHDFKAGKIYEIIVTQDSVALISWKEMVTEPDLSKPYAKKTTEQTTNSVASFW